MWEVADSALPSAQDLAEFFALEKAELDVKKKQRKRSTSFCGPDHFLYRSTSRLAGVGILLSSVGIATSDVCGERQTETETGKVREEERQDETREDKKKTGLDEREDERENEGEDKTRQEKREERRFIFKDSQIDRSFFVFNVVVHDRS